ncbi:MAG: flagellar basal body rod protein FlgC [Clostridia bacterium]|nr:flagellar basal body rod protein FlgC [Clostridia bacterium]
MAFLSSLNISGSGLTAQKMRMDIISENITNAHSTRTAAGGPYRRKMVVMQSTQQDPTFKAALIRASEDKTGGPVKTTGVKVAEIVEDRTPFTPTYNPTHPDADEDGYVWLPNVNTTQEMVDMMAASSAYKSNVTAFNATKAMLQQALEIGR